MTGAAGTALFHLSHVVAYTTSPADKNSTVTVATLKEGCVWTMAETCIECLEIDVLDVRMAFLTVAFHGKSGFPVMACPA